VTQSGCSGSAQPWRVLGLIPARGGSKGIPRKNIRLLGGRPLLEYTAKSALAAGRVSRVVLSTEDPEVAEVGRRCGLEVPFMRAVDLAQDATPSLVVVQDALRWLEERGDRFDAVCLLEPTTPLRRAGEIDACIALLEESGADAVATVRRVPDEFNPHWTYLRDAHGYLRLCTGQATPVSRRQDLPPAFHRDGSVYVARRDVVLERNSLYGEHLVGYVVDDRPCVNIDTPADWARAEELILASVGEG
jgi:CMP-N,N'-diacetyllegionaminic acid synthase